MKKVYLILAVFFCLGAQPGHAQYVDLYDFIQPSGSVPLGSLTLQGHTFYGTTYYGGAYDTGCVFSVDTNGNNYRDIHDFDVLHGCTPVANVTYAAGVLYGMTFWGGATKRYGCIFSVDTDGNKFRDMYDFDGTNGGNPSGSLLLLGSKLYGTLQDGGYIFSIDTSGKNYKVIYNFMTNNNLEGSLIYSSGLLYGMTYTGGGYDSGCVFSMDTSGNTFTDLYDFTGDTTGASPWGSLILKGNILYGMTKTGGVYGAGSIFSLHTNGSNYKQLFSFNGTNGQNPLGTLTAFSNTIFLGMTPYGGASGAGVIFSIDTNKNYVDLYDFNGALGAAPYGDVLLTRNTLYGTTSAGGQLKFGTIFSIGEPDLGIHTISAASGSVNVYPNPSNGQFTLSLSHPELVSGTQTIEIYNILGAKVYSAMLKQVQHDYEIDLSSQPNGVYLYRVITEDGSLAGEGKLVIER